MPWVYRTCDVCEGAGTLPTCELGSSPERDTFGTEPCFGCDGEGTIPTIVAAPASEVA